METPKPIKTPLQKIEIIIRTTDAEGTVQDSVFNMDPSDVRFYEHRPVDKRYGLDGNVEELIPAKRSFVVITGCRAVEEE